MNSFCWEKRERGLLLKAKIATPFKLVEMQHVEITKIRMGSKLMKTQRKREV